MGKRTCSKARALWCRPWHAEAGKLQMPKWPTWTFSRQSPTPPHHRRLWHCSKLYSSSWGGCCAGKDVRYAALDKKKMPRWLHTGGQTGQWQSNAGSKKSQVTPDFNLNSRVVIWIFHPLLVPALDQLLAALHTHRASSVDGIYVRVPGKWNFLEKIRKLCIVV